MNESQTIDVNRKENKQDDILNNPISFNQSQKDIKSSVLEIEEIESIKKEDSTPNQTHYSPSGDKEIFNFTNPLSVFNKEVQLSGVGFQSDENKNHSCCQNKIEVPLSLMNLKNQNGNKEGQCTEGNDNCYYNDSQRNDSFCFLINPNRKGEYICYNDNIPEYSSEIQLTLLNCGKLNWPDELTLFSSPDSELQVESLLITQKVSVKENIEVKVKVLNSKNKPPRKYKCVLLLKDNNIINNISNKFPVEVKVMKMAEDFWEQFSEWFEEEVPEREIMNCIIQNNFDFQTAVCDLKSRGY